MLTHDSISSSAIFYDSSRSFFALTISASSFVNWFFVFPWGPVSYHKVSPKIDSHHNKYCWYKIKNKWVNKLVNNSRSLIFRKRHYLVSRSWIFFWGGDLWNNSKVKNIKLAMYTQCLICYKNHSHHISNVSIWKTLRDRYCYYLD